MQDLTPRNINILKIIVEEYINTGGLVGSKSLLKKYDLGVSSATVRNDMAKLEGFGLIFQPYNSAGRFPTTKGLRIFINYMMKQTPDYFIAPPGLNISKATLSSLENSIHNIVYNLAKNTNEISFFVVPEDGICRYSGVADFLLKNHKVLGDDIYNIIKILEEKNNFIRFIYSLPIKNSVNVFIGEENMIGFLKDYTIIVRKVEIEGKEGYVGLIGSLRMDYSFNISAIRGIL